MFSNLDHITLLVILFSLCLGGFTKGVISWGFPVISLPILTIVLPPTSAEVGGRTIVRIGNEITGNPQLITPLVKPPKHNENKITNRVIWSKLENMRYDFDLMH